MADPREQGYPTDAVVPPDDRPEGARDRELGDFTTTQAVLGLGVAAVVVGLVVCVLALGLLDLIGLITHLAYTGRIATSIARPGVSVLGPLSVAVPVVGGMIVGLMARFGSERIRGHGIPEAMETILLRGSRMEPRLAVLKPISSAISIGTGGPFGAEGPIIVTGGAVGSIVGQFLHLTAIERRCLLVAGAAAGMTAVFGTPVAAVLLAVELLLFELRPRSMVPVSLAVCASEMLREELVHAGLLRAAPLFGGGPHGHLGLSVSLGAAVVGLACGALAWLMTQCVYGAEDLFGRLPLHWMWWPPLGGLVVGVGGLVDPRVLGVGYDTIGAELTGRLAIGTLAVLLVMKLLVWSVALGSNTSGGILAPLLMLGAALGGLLGAVLPGAGEGTWALIGMAAALAGVMRSPFTAIVFALELTHAVDALLALLIACTIAHVFSVLTLKRSILTEKIARRGYHVSREYAVDPLHALLVRDVMATDVVSVDAASTVAELYRRLPEGTDARRQRLYPVLDGDGTLAGVLAWSDVLAAHQTGSPLTASALARRAHAIRPDETLREAADQMVSSGHGVLPVTEDGAAGGLQGLVTQFDLLKAHERVLVEERHRERPLGPSTLPAGLGTLMPPRAPAE
ncbi:MAG TPA: chloride channel protein [Solirubrobacteraceae bacterium]|nr:chloride channel protein [Solirubrobacteraceae bacterium]